MVTQDERQSEAWRVAEADAEALRIRSYEDAARAVAAAVRRRPPTTQPPSVSHAQSCTHTHVTFKTVSPTFSSVLFVTEHPPHRWRRRAPRISSRARRRRPRGGARSRTW